MAVSSTLFEIEKQGGQSSQAFENPWDMVDITKYPITLRDSEAYRCLVDQCRKQMKESGYCLLQGFVTDEALAAMKDESRKLAPLAFHNTLTGNAYLTPDDSSLEQSDVRRLNATTALGAVAYDQFPAESLIRRLYEWDGLMSFLGEALGYDEIFRYADPLGGLNLAVMKTGDHLRWHFDQTDFVVSLLIQDCDAGGKYEVFPWTRSTTDEKFERVKEIIKGSREGITTLDITPGCLVLFMGRHSLHRVTAVEGETDRLIVLFGYDTKPGVESSDHLKMIRYGRTK